MGSRSVSPGAALLRSSRMFSIPKPLPEPPSSNLAIGDFKSPTMTRHYPQYQSITTPHSSREKGDWGFKRPLPLKTTMNTSTPLIRVKQVDSIESVTDFASAADHTLSLEKFQELRVAMTLPPKAFDKNSKRPLPRTDLALTSVFEEDLDFTDVRQTPGNDKRWKFQGPWLARMQEGDFINYLEKKVRPRRAEFRKLLKERLAAALTTRQNNTAKENGDPVPSTVYPSDITEEQFTDFLRSLRSDRATLYGLVSKFLDLAPLSHPIGIVQTIWNGGDNGHESPWGKSGPPPSHPSAGISYLRTTSYMENHPVYGPQARRTPVLSRVVAPRPRNGPGGAKLGVGGFITDVPAGDSEFNQRASNKGFGQKKMLAGILQLDTTTYGGAKAYVEPQHASVDPSGKVVVQLRGSDAESQLVAKESKGQAKVYTGQKSAPQQQQLAESQRPDAESQRSERVTSELLGDAAVKPQEEGKDVVGSSSTYGLDTKE